MQLLFVFSLRDGGSLEKNASVIGSGCECKLDECITGEIVAFTAVDPSQNFAAGTLISGLITGRSRKTDDPAVLVPVSDSFPVAGGSAGYPPARIAVDGIAAAGGGRADHPAVGSAESDLGAVLER